MALDPRTREEVYNSLKSGLTNRISKLTNFAENTFNYVWTQAFSQALHKQEVAATAVQLSGWVDYAGKELTQEDLDALGIEGVEPEEINQYMSSQHLDELGKEVGVTRNTGEYATGEVEITTTADTVTIPEGAEFGTNPDALGSYLAFYTTEKVSPDSGETTVTAPIQAGSVGEDFNVGSNTITYMPSPPSGVQSVTNPNATSGGSGVESDEQLRKSIKSAIFEKSGGGTKKGLEGAVESNVEGVSSVSVDEFTDASPTYVDVVVEGGEDSAVQEEIDDSRPVGVQHNLVRPTVFEVSIVVNVSGGSIDTLAVENALATYITNRPLGGNIIRDKIVQRVMNTDQDIEKIDNINLEVNEEVHTYQSGTSTYSLNKGTEIETDGIVNVTGFVNGSSNTFVEGTDFEETGSGGIDWSVGGDSPDDGTNFKVTYRIEDDLTIEAREKSEPATINVTV